MRYHFTSRLTATPNLCLIYFKITSALAILLKHVHNKFDINRTKIKDGCQLGRKVVTHNSKSDLPLVCSIFYKDSVNILHTSIRVATFSFKPCKSFEKRVALKKARSWNVGTIFYQVRARTSGSLEVPLYLHMKNTDSSNRFSRVPNSSAGKFIFFLILRVFPTCTFIQYYMFISHVYFIGRKNPTCTSLF